ncbi:unnamed protein product [Chondrus crispus]|uniref:Uncharacterized protein n=1 Tax=Chondrus crispus TaxID=2769 RepID=R7QFW7_CHOCR|nr:unnamed protein product [Chondrus crispus]CDF36315.1 unnamed protein product [Chondrus crispus]|eukprot:XP_005716134.1 unnamed protein product [Chondrus crispus]
MQIDQKKAKIKLTKVASHPTPQHNLFSRTTSKRLTTIALPSLNCGGRALPAMPRRTKTRSPAAAKHISLSAFDFRGDEAEKARINLQHSARSRKRKRSVLGLHHVDAPEPQPEIILEEPLEEPQPVQKRRTRVSAPAKPTSARRGRTPKKVSKGRSRVSRSRAAADDDGVSAGGGADASLDDAANKADSTERTLAHSPESPQDMFVERHVGAENDSSGRRRSLRRFKPTRKALQAVFESNSRRRSPFRKGGRLKEQPSAQTPASKKEVHTETKSSEAGAGESETVGGKLRDRRAPDDAAVEQESSGDDIFKPPSTLGAGRVPQDSESVMSTPVKLRVRKEPQAPHEEHPVETEVAVEAEMPQTKPKPENPEPLKPTPKPANKQRDENEPNAHGDAEEQLPSSPVEGTSAGNAIEKTAEVTKQKEISVKAAQQESKSPDKAEPKLEAQDESNVLPSPQKRSSATGEDASELKGTTSKSSPAKRVRFIEPQRANRSVRMNLHSFMKRKRRHERVRAPDVAVVPSARSGPDEKSRQVLLDELQYVLDGIFKYAGRKDKKPATVSLIKNSLQELTQLLLRKPNRPKADEDTQLDDDCGVVLQILATQPALLKSIVVGLFRILGMSRAVDLLVSLVFVIMFRSTVRILDVEENFLDSLIAGFLRNGAESLKQVSVAGTESEHKHGRNISKSEAQGRNAFGRRLSDNKKDEKFLAHVNEVIRKAGIKDEDFEGFNCEPDGSAHLMALALSLLLEGHDKAREWMRNNQRVHKVVAVLYSCQKALQGKSKQSSDSQESDSQLQAEEFEEHVALSLVTASAMRVLEFSTLDQACRLRVATESRICRVILDFIASACALEGGVVSADPLICQALRLAINLAHDCKPGTQEFVKQGGPQVVLDCLASECIGAGLIEGSNPESESEEAFDVRVLCLAFLISILDKEDEVREGFKKLCARDVPEREGGAITLVLELLKNVGKKQIEKMEAKNREKTATEEAAKIKRGLDRSSEDEVENGGAMEEKITTGYICLLLGALAHDCEGNKEFMKAALPQQSMLGVAAVLKEFLDFHHEVGVTSVAMDERYRSIISNLVKDAELSIPSLMQSSMDEDGDEEECTVEDMEGVKSRGTSTNKVPEGEEDGKETEKKGKEGTGASADVDANMNEVAVEGKQVAEETKWESDGGDGPVAGKDVVKVSEGGEKDGNSEMDKTDADTFGRSSAGRNKKGM